MGDVTEIHPLRNALIKQILADQAEVTRDGCGRPDTLMVNDIALRLIWDQCRDYVVVSEYDESLGYMMCRGAYLFGMKIELTDEFDYDEDETEPILHYDIRGRRYRAADTSADARRYISNMDNHFKNYNILLGRGDINHYTERVYLKRLMNSVHYELRCLMNGEYDEI